MAEDINAVTLVGRLTRDAELVYTNSGYAVVKFSLAINRRKKEGDNWIDEANYFDVQLWGKRGESLHQFLAKGQQLAVNGQLRQERWTQDGAKRSRIMVEASNIQLLGGRQAPGGQPDKQGENTTDFQKYADSNPSSAAPIAPKGAPREFDDDIPF